jgi:Spy/CpxP family protein refolding chaperone
MNRPRIVVPTALVLMFALGAVSHAQEGGGRRRGGGGFGGGFTIDKAALLGSAQVRQELKIGEDQGKKVDEILAAHRQEAADLFSGGRSRDASPEEREKRRKEMADKNAELRKKTEGKLAGVLEKEQGKRLGEIELQQQGLDGIVAENVVASLKLDKEQVGKIQAAIAARDEELRNLRGSGRGRGQDGGGGGQGGGGFEEMRAKMDKLRKDAEEKGLAVLSKEQRTELDTLKGKPFELDRRSLFGGRGGPGGGGGRGRGEGGGGGGERQRPPEDA